MIATNLSFCRCYCYFFLLFLQKIRPLAAFWSKDMTYVPLKCTEFGLYWQRAVTEFRTLRMSTILFIPLADTPCCWSSSHSSSPSLVKELCFHSAACFAAWQSWLRRWTGSPEDDAFLNNQAKALPLIPQLLPSSNGNVMSVCVAAILQPWGRNFLLWTAQLDLCLVVSGHSGTSPRPWCLVHESHKSCLVQDIVGFSVLCRWI